MMLNMNHFTANVAAALDKAGITVNKNMIPFDKESPFRTSGIRIGTPAVTTRGLKEPEMKMIGDWINRSIINRDNIEELNKIRSEVEKLCQKFPLYPELSYE